jgi:RNA-directed DNA polymerase
VVDADIEQFFAQLDHQILMAALRRRISDGEVLRLIYRWLKAGYLWEGQSHDTDQGSPQGGVLSPLLANVYLHGFDQAQRTQKAFIGRLTRYADDFVIRVPSGRTAPPNRRRAPGNGRGSSWPASG